MSNPRMRTHKAARAVAAIIIGLAAVIALLAFSIGLGHILGTLAFQTHLVLKGEVNIHPTTRPSTVEDAIVRRYRL